MKYLKIFYQYDNPERVLKIGHFTSQKLTGMGTAATNHFVFFSTLSAMVQDQYGQANGLSEIR